MKYFQDSIEWCGYNVCWSPAPQGERHAEGRLFFVPPHVFQPDDHCYCLCFRGHHVNEIQLVRCGHHVNEGDDLNKVESPVPRVKRRAEGGYFFRPTFHVFQLEYHRCYCSSYRCDNKENYSFGAKTL